MMIPRFPNRRGRPAKSSGSSRRTYCCYGECNTSTFSVREVDESGIFFVPFEKPCLKFRKGDNDHKVLTCTQCKKANRWLKACRRGDERFDKLEHIHKGVYICSLHFVGGKGPTPNYPDPVTAALSARLSSKPNKKRKELVSKSLDSPNKKVHISPVSDEFSQNRSQSKVPPTVPVFDKPEEANVNSSVLVEIVDNDSNTEQGQNNEPVFDKPEEANANSSVHVDNDSNTEQGQNNEPIFDMPEEANYDNSSVHLENDANQGLSSVSRREYVQKIYEELLEDFNFDTEPPDTNDSHTNTATMDKPYVTVYGETNKHVDLGVSTSTNINVNIDDMSSFFLQAGHTVSCDKDKISIYTLSSCVNTRKIEIFRTGEVAVQIFGKKLSEDHELICELRQQVISYAENQLGNATNILSFLENWKVCAGIQDTELIESFNIQVIRNSQNGFMNALTESIHSNNCLQVILVPTDSKLSSFSTMCPECKIYKKTLLKISSKQKSVENVSPKVSSSTNLRWMTLEQVKDRYQDTKNQKNVAIAKCKRLSERLRKKIHDEGHDIGTSDTRDFLHILGKIDLPAAGKNQELMKLFISEQVAAASCSSKNGIRWHPTILKLCIYWESKSPGTYDSLRNSGFMVLPSRKTIRKYAKFNNDQGFVEESFQELRDLANLDANPSHHAYVSIVHDEMKICDDIVYNKNTGELVGFVNSDCFQSAFSDLEDATLENSETKPPPVVASSVLQLMVCGLTSKLCHPLAFFPCSAMQSHELYRVFWEGVKRLELHGFKVILNVCDGAGSNRAFFKLCCPNADVPYKVRNYYATDEDRYIYLVSDAPHLIKTARNCVSNSNFHMKTRYMWNGTEILWTHFIDLFQKENASFEKYAPKLTQQHIYLNSFSLMRVKLATQVLSETVACAMETVLGDKAKATVEFCRMFNKFFDILNCRNLLEGRLTRNQNLCPFTDPDDHRLKWLEDTFLRYLDDWETAVMRREKERGSEGEREEQFKPEERKKMLLSDTTREGLRITVKSTVEYVRFLLLKGADFVLTARGNQDRLEHYFGMQRACGGSSENPNIQSYGENVAKLKRLKEVAPIVRRGNVEAIRI